MTFIYELYPYPLEMYWASTSLGDIGQVRIYEGVANSINGGFRGGR